MVKQEGERLRLNSALWGIDVNWLLVETRNLKVTRQKKKREREGEGLWGRLRACLLHST